MKRRKFFKVIPMLIAAAVAALRAITKLFKRTEGGIREYVERAGEWQKDTLVYDKATGTWVRLGGRIE